MSDNKNEKSGGKKERLSTHDRKFYEEPPDLKDLKTEVRERAQGLIKYISDLAEISHLLPAESVSTQKGKKLDSEGISERTVNKLVNELERRLNELKDIERVVDPDIREKRASSEAIERYRSEIRDSIRNILNNPQTSSIYREIAQEFTNQRLSQLKWFELEKLTDILKKVERDEPLKEREAGFLRYCAYFPFEESELKSPETEPKPLESEFKPPELKLEQKPKFSEFQKFSGTELKTSEPEPKYPEPESKLSEPPTIPSSESRPHRLESIERQVLSIEEAERLLNQAICEYLNRYRDYIRLQTEFQRERDVQRRLELSGRLHELENLLNNAEKLYNTALENYKLSLYFEHLKRKKDYLAVQIKSQKGEIFTRRIKDENPNISPEELNKRVDMMIQDEVERIINEEREELNRNILGIIAYDVLRREEALNAQKLNILREEKQRTAGFWGRLWQRYQGLSYGRKALIGAAIAGVGGGILGVLGGLGFAALGTGVALAGRRFLGGFVVGGGVKSVADRLITRKEQRKLDEETRKRIDQIRGEISDIISHPDKEPKDYEKWLVVMRELDNRINSVIQERENIRNKSNRSRRRWTLIAALIGGVASNADNIYHLFAGQPESVLVPTEGGEVGGGGAGAFVPEGGFARPTREFVPPPSKSVEQLFVQESPLSIETPLTSTDLPSWLKELSLMNQSKIPVLVGKGGFWEAAQNLKQMLGLSDVEFAKAWSNSTVLDPISGQKFPLPQAHYVASLVPDQQIGLVYDLKNGVFEAVLGPKVKIGGAKELIEAWKKVTGGEPPFKVIWSMMRGGSKI